MERLTVLVDLDDTIEDLLTAWIHALNERFGRDVDPEHVRLWDVLEYYPGLSKSDIYSVFDWDNFWSNVKPKPGAVEYMKRLIDDGHKVYIVTATYYLNIQVKMEMVLFKYFPFLKWDQVIIAQDKAMIDGDVIIDDGIHNHLRKRRLNVLMDAPHNRHIDAATIGAVRAESMEEAYRAVSELANRSLINEEVPNDCN